MRSLIMLFVAVATIRGADFTVHEWGTFTSVVGSTGGMLAGLEVEEAALPSFVGSLAGFAPTNKGWDRPVSGVTVKMETPVLYFYSSAPFTARVEVGFHGGSISQWYPGRLDGEQLPPLSPGQNLKLVPAVDFSTGHEGRAVWQVDVLARNSPLAITAPRESETPQWPRARVAAANRVRGPKGEVESFIFYRGVGNFALPLRVTCDAQGRVQLKNTGAAAIPFVGVYEGGPRCGHGDAIVWWHGALPAGETRVAPTRGPAVGAVEMPASRFRATVFPAALLSAGLTRDEAAAMLETWRESYFERPGLRVFWIVPRAFTDAVLPIEISPAPAKLERVLVGRTEVLTPDFEAELRRDFATDGGKKWAGDRYARAYRERMRELGGIVGIAPAVGAP